MNTHAASEHAAAIELQAKAANLVCTYEIPEYAPDARVGLFLTALQNELDDQKLNQNALIAKADLLRTVQRYVNGANDAETMHMLKEQLAGMLESINYSFLHPENQE